MKKFTISLDIHNYGYGLKEIIEQELLKSLSKKKYNFFINSIKVDEFTPSECIADELSKMIVETIDRKIQQHYDEKHF